MSFPIKDHLHVRKGSVSQSEENLKVPPQGHHHVSLSEEGH